MQILIGFEFMVAIAAATVFLYSPVRCLRFIGRHCLLQARGLEARERCIRQDRDEVWEVV